MTIHSLAGKSAPYELLVNVPKLISDYFALAPDSDNPETWVSFGTSGHRGSSSNKSFNEAHILAISQAICEYRKGKGYNGILFIGKDTHALSEPAFYNAIEVFAANGIEIAIQAGLGYTPTPVISHAILAANRNRLEGLSDGVVITPSHNPPEDGGFKYNPPSGGPADTATTQWVQNRANEIIRNNLRGVKRISYEKAIQASTTHHMDFITPYVSDIKNVVNMAAISDSGMRIGVDPMGGAGIKFWQPIAETYGLNLTVVNPRVDPTFSFMTLDWDGKIRMDCSSQYAMAGLVKLKDQFDISFGNDTDYDRHGIVTPSAGLMAPNHYLATAIWYLFQNRPEWSKNTGIGKTLVSSAMIDRIAKFLKRELYEVPVGFKWFVDGLADGSFGFGGEESAGASFLRTNAKVWTTDKDGFIMDLLSAEILAKTGLDPAEHYRNLEAQFGRSWYARIDAPATGEEKVLLSNLTSDQVKTENLAGEKITAKLTYAPYNQAAIGGLKVVTENSWFAARPSGTEDVYKIYAESFLSEDHLQQIQREAQIIVNQALAG